MHPAARTRFWTFLLMLVPLGVAGCATGEQRKPVFPVRGKVLVGSKPAVRAQVIFHPLNDPDPQAVRPNGEVQADGSFTLNTYTAGDGAPAGEYAVTVLWASGSSAIGGDADSGPDRLGGRYANPEKTTLRAQVREGDNELPPFQLK
jgi:hypothetical protein